MVKFMPADFKLTETRQAPLKDQYDEWLAKLICYAFAVPASASPVRSIARRPRHCARRPLRKVSRP